MATPVKTAQGNWRIQLEIDGKRVSKTLPTRKEVVAWALSAEGKIRSGPRSTRTLADALDRYAEEVSEHHRGWAKEQIRLRAFLKHPSFPGKVFLDELKPDHIAAWRDARLKTTARGSVLRDMGLLSAVLETARLEWRWVPTNVCRDVRKPAEPDHRERLITGPEIRTMLRTLGHGGPVRTVSQACAMAFLMALVTGMRAGEICGLKWSDMQASSARLEMTKNGSARQVPLSSTAQRLVERMRGWDTDLVFGIKSQTLDALFRKARAKAGLSGFTFHDSRHTAATRIGKSGKLQLLEMCRMFGWKNTNQALVYFNMTARELAAKLG